MNFMQFFVSQMNLIFITVHELSRTDKSWMLDESTVITNINK